MSRAMKDSGVAWIGKIPEHWQQNTVFQVFTQVKKRNTELQEKNLLSLSYGKIKRKDIETTEGLLPESFDGYNIIEPGDIVLRLTDLQNDQRSLRVGLATERGIVTSAYLTIRPRSQSQSQFLYYFLHAFDISKGFYGMGAGVRQGLNWDGIKWLKILVPPLPEQSRIAAFLDRRCSEIDRVIASTQSTIEEYKKLKQSIITEAVTHGVRGPRKMKDSGVEWIGEIPEEWGTAKLKYFASIRSGITLGKVYPTGTELFEFPYLRVANVQGGHVKFDDIATIMVTKEESMKYRLQTGELLMTEGGDRDKLGRGTVWHGEIEPCLHQNHVFALNSDSHRLIAEFIEYLSISFVGRDYFDVTANQSVHLASTNTTTILNFIIPYPTTDEQIEIVAFLSSRCTQIEQMIEAKQRLLAELEAYKKSVIYEYVTGKREVPA